MNDYATIPELMYHIGKNLNLPAIFYHRVNGSWARVSTDEFVNTVNNLSNGLRKLGVKRGDKVGIISNPSPFWVMADFAIILSGCITVPIFRRISPENLGFEIEDSKLDVIFIGDENEYEPVMLCGKRISKVITIGFKRDDPLSVTFDEVAAMGMKTDTRESPVPGIAPDDIFTIIYTSGSMGIPKGVELTHRNIISQIRDAAICFDLRRPEDRALSSLPLSHIFERMVMYFYISTGIPVYFVDDLNNIGKLISEVRPTIMTAVPRLLEKMLSRIRETSAESGGIRKIIALSALDRAESKDPTASGSPLDLIYDLLVYSKIRKALGGKFRYVISGAASLPENVGKFFANIGVPLYEGYGMTEASPVISCNRKAKNKPGTVGVPFPSVSVKISDEGEILAHGPNVMKGYHNNKEETEKAIDGEGYLHTGDLGRFDGEGFLIITGRKKELFKKSTGEYVPPIPIEQALSKLDIVDMAVVIADKRRFVSCLIFPDMEKTDRIRREQGFDRMTTEEFLESEFMRKKISDYIHEMNRHLHHTEEVQKFKIIKKPISIETGEITPTYKIRRGIIEEKFRNEIEEMYK